MEFDEAEDAAEARENMNSMFQSWIEMICRRRILWKGDQCKLLETNEGYIDFIKAKSFIVFFYYY